MLGIPLGRTGPLLRSALQFTSWFLMGYGLGALANTAPLAIGLATAFTTLGVRWYEARGRRAGPTLSHAASSDATRAERDGE